MENIFITGVAGFLGSHLAKTLIKKGHKVKGNDNLIGGYEDNIPIDMEFYKTDCNDLEGMLKITKGTDILYHCAAHPYEGLSVFSPSMVTNSVFQATSTTLSAFTQNRGERFVYCSSMARYGMNQTPFTEEMGTRPQDPYAIAKVAAEDLTKLMSRIHGFEYSIAVPHNIYGPQQKYDDPFRNVGAIFINKMLMGEQPKIYGDGNQRRCFSYIKDDIPLLVDLGFNPIASGETVNIGPDDEFVTINYLAETIAEIIGFDLKPEYYPERPQEVQEANCSANKARKLFGFNPEYTLRNGLEEMIDWVKEKGPKKFDYHLPVEIINNLTPKTWSKGIM